MAKSPIFLISVSFPFEESVTIILDVTFPVKLGLVGDFPVTCVVFFVPVIFTTGLGNSLVAGLCDPLTGVFIFCIANIGAKLFDVDIFDVGMFDSNAGLLSNILGVALLVATHTPFFSSKYIAPCFAIALSSLVILITLFLLYSALYLESLLAFPKTEI